MDFGGIFIACPAIAFALMIALGTGGVLERLQGWVDAHPRRIVLAPVGLWVLYLIYAVGVGVASGRAAAVMAVYLAVPFLAFWPVRNRPLRIWIEPFVILWSWLPIELGVIRSVLIRRQGLDIHYAFAQLLAIDAGILAFIVWNRVPNVGYRFKWNRTIVITGLVSFAAFAVIGIPLAFAIHFVGYAFTTDKLLSSPALFIGIFLFTALPEEFLFRGLMQNWITRVTKRPALGLVIASIIFGASHLNNGSPIPNYRYFLLASIAGVFYGWAWQRTGSLMASSLVHALVDTCWSVFFR